MWHACSLEASLILPNKCGKGELSHGLIQCTCLTNIVVSQACKLFAFDSSCVRREARNAQVPTSLHLYLVCRTKVKGKHNKLNIRTNACFMASRRSGALIMAICSLQGWMAC